MLVLNSKGSWCAVMHEFGAKVSHMVIVDGFDEAGLVMIRDPFGGVSYRMTMENLPPQQNLWVQGGSKSSPSW